DIYAASEPEIPGVTSAKLAEAIRATGQPVEHVGALGDLRRAVRAAMLPGDVVLFLGAGDITKAAQELAAELREEAVSANEQTLAALTACLSPDSLVRGGTARQTHHAARRWQSGLLRRAGVGRRLVARAEV